MAKHRACCLAASAVVALVLVPSTAGAALPDAGFVSASAYVSAGSDPFASADGSIHENWQDDYLVEACIGDDENAMTFNPDGMPVTDDSPWLTSLGGSETNGCFMTGSVYGMNIGGTGGSTDGNNTGVKGTFTLTAPAGATITGLEYADAAFVVGPDAGSLISGWFGELANNSDGQGLAADHDPTQSYSNFENGVTSVNDCVNKSPRTCTVPSSGRSGLETFVFNANPWTPSTAAAPALQEIGFGFECRGADCHYVSGQVWSDVQAAVFQLNDPVNDPAAGAGAGGSAGFDGRGASAGNGGWVSASQVGATTFTTASDPAGICSLAAGLYDSAGDPVDVDQDSGLPAPAIDPATGYYDSSFPCASAGGPVSFTYTPNAAALSQLPSGTYYLNAVASDPAGYQQGNYSWYAGGLNLNSNQAAGQGIPINIDNTQPTVTITPGASGWNSGIETESVTVTGTTGPSGLKALSCTNNAVTATPTSSNSGTDTETNTYVVTGVGDHTFSCDVTNGVGMSGIGSADIKIDALTAYGSSPEIDGGNDPYSNGPSQTGWYRGAQQVTVTADKSNGAGIIGIDCQGAGQNDDYVNSQPGLDESATVNVTAPGGTLTCQATDAAGNIYPLGSYVFNIDDTAPSGSFSAQDPGDPALIDVQTVSSGAPITDVEITFTCKSGPCLTANGSGGPYPIQSEKAKPDGNSWAATVPDNGLWPNGDYALSASITDAAGNVGSATKLPDGSSAGISLPARVLTTLAATLSADGKTAATAPNQVTPELRARATPDKRHRHRYPSRITLGYGTGATVRGRLRYRHGGAPIKDARVVIYQRLASGGRLRKLGVTRTGAHGRFAYRLPAGASRTVTIAYGGNAITHPASGHITESFRGRVRIGASTNAIAGEMLVIHGRVDGKYLPRGGLLVQPRYKLKGFGGGWAPFGSAVRSNAHGRFTIRIQLAAAAAKLTYLLDVRVQQQSGYDYLTTVSPILTRYVER